MNELLAEIKSQLPPYLLDSFNSVWMFFSQIDYEQLMEIIKIISGTISALLFLFLIYLIIGLSKVLFKKIEYLAEGLTKTSVSIKLTREWQAVIDKLNKGDEANLKLAVIEADNLLDGLFKRMGYQGENMADRLKQINPAQLASLEEIWQVHKIRNQIVHQPDFRLTASQAKQIIEIYQKALEELEAL